jgi:hypothetical protein
MVFLLNHTGKEGDGSIEAASKGLTIIASSYGGCSLVGCPSYRIENNGSYTYILRNPEGNEVRYEDKLSTRQLEVLRTQVKETDFDYLDDTEFVGTCPIAFDGLAYEYVIEYKGERYEVDSCIEVLSGSSFFKTLEEYFTVFALLYGNTQN